MWNKSIKIIGSVKATNYIYFVPLITIATSEIFINEKITNLMIYGGILIILGVYISNGRLSIKEQKIQQL
jgi:drug/metabolite transporter (DMT)-like permease